MTPAETESVPCDSELVGRVRHGDIDVYALLVQRYERLVRATIQRVTRDRHATEDAAQEAFLAAYDSLASLRQADRFGPWLLAIARNQAIRSVRRTVRTDVLPADLAAASHCSNGRLTEPSEWLLELVERLPDHERIVVGLRYFEGHAVDVIATITGRPIGTVTKQLSRAHARLERWMKQEIHR